MNWFRNLLLRIGIDITPRKELYAKIENLQNYNDSLKNQNEHLQKQLKDVINDRNRKDQMIIDLEDEVRMLRGCCDSDEECCSDC